MAETHNAGNGAIDLLEVRTWTPRAALSPRCSGGAATSLVAAANGSPGCYGGWELVYPAGETGDTFLFRVQVRWKDLVHGFESTAVEVKWEDADGKRIDWAPVHEWEKKDGWLVLQKKLTNNAGAVKLVVKLLLRWSACGVVEWRQPELIPAQPDPPRRLRLGAAAAPLPSGPRHMQSNCDWFLSLCRRAGEERVDLLCLPETILNWGIGKNTPDEMATYAIDVPGPYTDRFSAVARQYRMVICLCVLEKSGDLLYNAAILIDESGAICGKYHKVHLAPGEDYWGITPGDSFPVVTIAAAQARVGMNICMDSSVVESSRLVARAGADILLMPIMGDHRADRWDRGSPRFDIQRWMMIQQMRAMDNHLYLVAARNDGVGTGVFAPDGTILAMNGGDRAVVWADVDLNDLKNTWTGAAFKDVVWSTRREHVYGPLTGDLLPQVERW